MANRKNNQPQTVASANGSEKGELLPPETTDETATSPKVKTVTGHRLVKRAERFVVEDSPAPEATNGSGTAEEMDECRFCRGKFSDDEWEENAGFCPNCNRDDDGNIPQAAPELSEAEILLQSIANDDEYSLRVDRLPNYEKDLRADSRAERVFCRTLKPVTLDYLDVIRSTHGGGDYLLSMYKRGRGLVKMWHDAIDKPEPPPAAVAQPAPVPAPPAEDSVDAITGIAKKFKALQHALIGDELEQLREELKTRNRNDDNGNNGAPDNPYALLTAVMASGNSSLTEKLIDRIVPEETKTTWMGDLLAHPQEAMQLFTIAMTALQNIFNARPPVNSNGNNAPAPIGPPPAPQVVGPSSPQEAGMLVVMTLADDIAKNRRVGRVADLIEEMTRKFPTIRQQVIELLSSDNAAVLQQIHLASTIDLSGYAQADDFLNELREELEQSGYAEDGPPGNPPSVLEAVATGPATQPESEAANA